ncbi:ribonucleoside-triphosphate reductase, adenosylcobalamin-dependent [Catenuloplanes sp. NPDC051500]|uniref:ribonucleoside-triphosphate reductase, adenosylcobalamin-dependent n=1 Tax=Catenuloplanes sp. NPDC051500 TaxID=3363959 RepID=UPI003794673B
MTQSFITLPTEAEQDWTWGGQGELVYDRTYARPLPRGGRETWPETVDRVARGNLELVYGPQVGWTWETREEFEELRTFIRQFKIIPAGRHLWASGVRGASYLYNCHVSGWHEKLSDHFEFSFLRLMEGGGVGANYSSRFLARYGAPRRQLRVHIVCDPAHADYEAMRSAGILSDVYDSDWEGSFEIEDSREGWAAALVDLIDTFMTDDRVQHKNRVYDVSRVRPAGARLKTFGGTASGPQPLGQMLHKVALVLNEEHRHAEVDERMYDGAEIVVMSDGETTTVSRLGQPYMPYHVSPIAAMDIDHAIAECVVSGGVRRSARMAIVEWDDPWVAAFLACKRDPMKNWTTNISVGIDGEFIRLLGEVPDSSAPGFRTAAHAQWVHGEVVRGMLGNGEPGYWNRELTNVGEVNEVIATNPCGEIGLPAWGACVLGHVNMSAFAPTRRGGPVDHLGLLKAHRLMTRFTLRATYGDMNDPKQAEVMNSERRIGVGHFGVQDFYAKQGVPYSEVPHLPYLRKNLRELAQEVRDEARRYAFQLRIPEPVKVTTVAPTGTISKLPGVGGEGIHPIYSRFFIRRIRFSMTDPAQAMTVAGYRGRGFLVETDVYDQSGNTAVVAIPTKATLLDEVEALGYSASSARMLVESADELSLDQLLAFQAMYQVEWADNAVSFTANLHGEHEAYDVAETIRFWLPVLKGTTIMPDNGSRAQAPYERITEDAYLAAKATEVGDGVDEDCATGACPVR